MKYVGGEGYKWIDNSTMNGEGGILNMWRNGKFKCEISGSRRSMGRK